MFWHLHTLLSLAISGKYISEQKADLMATLYDVGGIIGDNMITLHDQIAIKYLIVTPIQVVSLLE